MRWLSNPSSHEQGGMLLGAAAIDVQLVCGGMRAHNPIPGYMRVAALDWVVALHCCVLLLLCASLVHLLCWPGCSCPLLCPCCIWFWALHTRRC
jgi:hypothetical protein